MLRLLFFRHLALGGKNVILRRVPSRVVCAPGFSPGTAADPFCHSRPWQTRPGHHGAALGGQEVTKAGLERAVVALLLPLWRGFVPAAFLSPGRSLL